MEPNGSISVLLADGHALLREGLRRSLEGAGIEVVGEASDGHSAVRLTRELRPDVVVMDVCMDGIGGVEATRLIRQQAPTVRVIMLTTHGEHSMVTRALRAGASGYLLKDCTSGDVVRAIRQVCSHGAALSTEVAAAVLTELLHHKRRAQSAATNGSTNGNGNHARKQVLSRREEEILRLVADGASSNEIADHLFISVKTVKNHLTSIYQKLGSRDRTQAILQAVRLGIVHLD
jgi:two-component system, NarL family, response regulator DegU